MKKKISIIVGGSGQLGISLIKILLKKKFKVVVTTRDINKARKKVKNNKHIITKDVSGQFHDFLSLNFCS